MKAFVFVNDNGAAYCRYAKNEIPAQFVYGVSKLEKMGFEVKVGEGRLFKDLVSFWKFKPDLFFMPFLKRKTMLYFILAKIFMFPTKFAGWMHLDVFSPPGSRLKRMIHSLLLPFLQLYVKRIDAIFFLIKLAKKSFYQDSFLRTDVILFPGGGRRIFTPPLLKCAMMIKSFLQGERIGISRQ